MTDSLQSRYQVLEDELIELNFAREVDRNNSEIAERLLMELITEIEENRRNIESISKEKDELLGIAAHDLRSPLSVILGTARLLETRLTQENHEFIQTILRASIGMLELLNSTLDIEKIEHGRVSLELQQQKVLPVLKKSVDNYLPMAQEKNIRIEYGEATDDALVSIDRIRMEEVLNNLLSNAIKYSHPGTKVTLSTALSNGHIQISVKDQGMGIRQEELDKIFTRFAQISNKPTAGESSTGLGLAIVKKLVELQDGTVAVSSVHGQGSTFTVTLPVLGEITEAIMDERPLPITQELPIPTELSKVLLIDDSQGVRQLLIPILRSLGLEVVGEASDGERGLALYRQLKPDLVFLDVVMPLMSGIEVLRQIKLVDAEAIVVMLTSMANRENVMEAKNLGAFAYLLKPFEVQKVKRVVSMIKQILAEKGGIDT